MKNETVVLCIRSFRPEDGNTRWHNMPVIKAGTKWYVYKTSNDRFFQPIEEFSRVWFFLSKELMSKYFIILYHKENKNRHYQHKS